MKNFLLPLSIFMLLAQTAIADVDASSIKSQLVGKEWKGLYAVEYYSSVADKFFYKSSDNVFDFPGSDMTLGFGEKNGLLVYEWDREVLGSGESDDKTCATKIVKKTKKGKSVDVEVGKTLPRIILFKSDLYAIAEAKVDAAIPASVNAAQNAAEKAKAKGNVDGLFLGIQAKLKLRDPLVAIIKGTSCAGGEKGVAEKTTPLADLGDITVPVLEIKLNAAGTHVDIIASLGTQEDNGYPDVMGYSTYSMEKQK